MFGMKRNMGKLTDKIGVELQNNAREEGLLDEQRRRFLLTATGVLGGIGAVCALKPFIASWLPSAKAEAAGAPVRVDLSTLLPGQQVTVAWRGKPVWIIRRTPDMLKQLDLHNAILRDQTRIQFLWDATAQ